MKRLSYLTLLIAIILISAIIYSFYVSTPLYKDTLAHSQLSTLPIAPAKEALTFARTQLNGKTTVILVTQYTNDKLTGINLNQVISSPLTDPIAIFNQLGYEALQRIILNRNKTLTLAINQLIIPIDTQLDNIGVGGNYLEHIEESGLKGEPVFVFPKKVQPTLFNSAINGQIHGRLDYEAELGLVPLSDITKQDAPPKYLGFILCNDFTDRLTLVKDINQSLPMGTTGFALAKSQPGFLPLGNLFVIPKDYEKFLEKVNFKLYVNNRLRQSEIAANMREKPKDIFELVFINNRLSFYSDDQPNPLLTNNRIPKGTIILSGTPAGVIFRIANVLNPMVYLKKGDQVSIQADYLGAVINEIL